MSALSILVVDDDASVRDSLQKTLEAAGYHSRAVKDGLEALSVLQKEAFEIVLCDQQMPRVDGLTFIGHCQELCPNTAVVLMTGFGSQDMAVRAMKAGAYDYISKPFTAEELMLTLRKVEERESLKAENENLKSAINQKLSFSNIIAKSDSMQSVFETVKRLANFATTVLIVGESGTGKELIAQALHHNSPRRGKPFIPINCGAIPENLMESELFGHKKGAFTDATSDKRGLFEEASGGTIFLDEIGEMPLHLQVKLLRALQERQIRRVGDEELRPIDVRIIAATLRDLEQDVKVGRFRDDLYYRLNVVNLTIPPLRDRPEDIGPLVEHFLRKHNKRMGLNITDIDPQAMKALLSYRWRGNVRELENCMERAMVLTESSKVDLASLPENILQETKSLVRGASSEEIDYDDLSIKKRTRALEIKLILKALERTKGNRTHAAKVLELSHRALLYKLKEYGLGGKETE